MLNEDLVNTHNRCLTNNLNLNFARAKCMVFISVKISIIDLLFFFNVWCNAIFYYV